jgi:hypothetical protein
MNKTEEFIEKARKVHGDRYDYSKVEFVKAKEKVCIICPEHGEFWQLAKLHLKGHGCAICGRISCKTKRSKTLNVFLSEAKNIHGDKYDYSKVNYINAMTPVEIICPIHGAFWQRPNDHIHRKYKCKKCARNNRMTTTDFIEKARLVHGRKYDYSKVRYVSTKNPVTIICPEHGEFEQRPEHHLKGCGCKACWGRFTIAKKLSFLKSEDLVHLSSHQLIEIIGSKKLPREFKSLIYTPANSDARISTIQQLKNLFGNNANDEDIEKRTLDLAREKENDASSVKLETMETNNDDTSLLSTISEIHIHDNFIHTNPSDDSAKFLVLEEIHKLWNKVLELSEEGKLEDGIETIKNENGGAFWKHIQNTFLHEFDEVNNIKPSKDYKFPYEPSLMQKLMVYHLMNNNSFGNWCGTGSGKTNIMNMLSSSLLKVIIQRAQR